MKIAFVVISLFVNCIISMAQKKEIAQVRTYLKSGKDLDKAESLMNKVLSDTINSQNIKFWLLLYDVVKAKYDKGNEKLYLKQSYDTASIFILTDRMFTIFEKVDSMENKLNTNKSHYKKKDIEILCQYQPNLYNGGIFFLRRGNYDKAFYFFDHYIRTVQMSMFKEAYRGIDNIEKDTLLSHATYYAVYSGYKIQNWERTTKWLDLALSYGYLRNYTLHYISDMYLSQDNIPEYLTALYKGFNDYIDDPYFYSNLIEYYSAEKKWTNAEEIVNKALDSVKNDLWLYVSKTTILLNLGKYDECIFLSDSIMLLDNTVAILYLNAGLSYYNKAIKLEKNSKVTKETKKQIQTNYKLSLPYLEKYKNLRKEGTSEWALPLYNIYLNLNMGKEFEEIDALMRKK